MNSLCIYFLFYLFLSGSILFTILGVFAGFGNPVLIIENTQKDQNNLPIEEEGIKKRVTIQYFIASFLDLSFSFIFLLLIYNINKKSQIEEEIKNKNYKGKDKIEKNILNNENIENKDEIQTNSINNESNNQGMSEKV